MAENGGHGEEEAHQQDYHSGDNKTNRRRRVLHDVAGSRVLHKNGGIPLPANLSPILPPMGAGLSLRGSSGVPQHQGLRREEFGFACGDDGQITLPCDTTVMEYAMCLLRRDAPAEVVKAFMSSIARPCRFDGGPVARCIGLSQHVAVC